MNITVEELYWADMIVASNGDISYGAARKLCGATSVNITYNRATSNVYESGASIRHRDQISGGTAAVSTHSLSEKDKAALAYGISGDAGIMGGPSGAGDDIIPEMDYTVGGDSDKAQRGALGFSVLKEHPQTGDTYHAMFWLLDASMSPADATYSTSDENGPNNDPDTYNFGFGRRPTDKKYQRNGVTKTDGGKTAFFSSVEKSA